MCKTISSFNGKKACEWTLYCAFSYFHKIQNIELTINSAYSKILDSLVLYRFDYGLLSL